MDPAPTIPQLIASQKKRFKQGQQIESKYDIMSRYCSGAKDLGYRDGSLEYEVDMGKLQELPK